MGKLPKATIVLLLWLHSGDGWDSPIVVGPQQQWVYLMSTRPNTITPHLTGLTTEHHSPHESSTWGPHMHAHCPPPSAPAITVHPHHHLWPPHTEAPSLVRAPLAQPPSCLLPACGPRLPKLPRPPCVCTHEI
jgi:hypothetical protein